MDAENEKFNRVQGAERSISFKLSSSPAAERATTRRARLSDITATTATKNCSRSRRSDTNSNNNMNNNFTGGYEIINMSWGCAKNSALGEA